MLRELEELVKKQKTISTKRLKPYIDRLFEAFHSMNQRNQKLELKLKEMNRLYQKEKSKREALEKKNKKLRGIREDA